MRVLVRPFCLFAILCGFTHQAQYSDAAGAAPGFNTFVWTQGFPAPTVGGVDVSVDIGPAAGWTCTDVTLRVIDASTSKTLGEFNQANPPAVVAKSFNGLPNKLRVRVTGDAVFQNNGKFDVKQIQTFVTTK